MQELEAQMGGGKRGVQGAGTQDHRPDQEQTVLQVAEQDWG